MCGTRNLILVLSLIKKEAVIKKEKKVTLTGAINLPQSSNNHKAELELMLTFF